MPKYFSRQLLYRIRNEIPLATLVAELQWPHKTRDGRLCFLCPRCGELIAVVNPRTNLARCFPCEVNFNTIDLTMSIKECDFVDAVHFLQQLLPTSQAS
jgi:DNA primase